MRVRLIVLAAAVAAVAIGCAPTPGATPSPTSGGTVSSSPTPDAKPMPTMLPSVPTGTPTPAPEAILDGIRAVLKGKDVDVSDMRVVVSDRVTWPDSSLGCPEPGMQYAQALVEGWHIVAKVGDRSYDFRLGSATGHDVRPMLCERARTKQ